MNEVRCPKCRATTVVELQLFVTDPHGQRYMVSGLLGLKLSVSRVPVQWLHSCFSCGHIWTDMDPLSIRTFLEEECGELGKQYAAVLEFGPLHDLPDLPEAHEAGRGVAEMDVLVLAGKELEARRRFRELTHHRWNETIDAVTHWHTLKRSRKLALFGWQSKEGSDEVEPELADHPMRDRLLDG